MVVTGKAIVSKIRKIIRSNGRYTICNISKAVGISLWISVRWIPHILTRDRSKTGTSSTTNTKLKMFPKYQSNYQHSNLFLLFQTSKKNGNKIWQTKHGRRPFSCQKKGSYCIFFLICEGIEGRSATYMYMYQFHRDVILRKFKKYHY